MTTGRRWLAASGAAALLIAGSAPAAKRHGDAVPANWRAIATPADRERVRGWRDTWVAALVEARRSNSDRVDAEGSLLQPDAGLVPVAPTVGEYKCRVLKLGTQVAHQPGFVATPPFRCRIVREDSTLSFAKLDGAQRPRGLLLPGIESRMMFLGTMVLGDEQRAQKYGSDSGRDVVGFLERVGAQRWRLVLPRPRWESLLDVIELVPAD